MINGLVTETEEPESWRGVRFRTDDRSVDRFGKEQCPSALAEDGCFLWIDIQAPTVAPLNEALHRLGLDLNVGRHVDYPALLPRVFEHPDCMVCYLYEVKDPDHHLHVSRGLGQMQPNRLILVISQHFVVTFHREPIACIDYVEKRSTSVFRFEGSAPSFIAYLLFQRCMLEYAHLNLANDNYLDRLHSGLQTDDFEQLAGIIDLARANILTLKKMTASLQIVLGRLTTMQTPFIDSDFRARVLQLHRNVFPVRWALDSSRQFIDGIVAGMQTAASNRMSEIATVLTIVSTIILPLTLITGVYGMNFDHMPELHVRGAYFICLGIMTSVVAVELWLFYRLGWLRTVLRPLRRLAPERRHAEPADAEEFLQAPSFDVLDDTIARRGLARGGNGGILRRRSP